MVLPIYLVPFDEIFWKKFYMYFAFVRYGRSVLISILQGSKLKCTEVGTYPTVYQGIYMELWLECKTPFAVIP